MMFVAVLPRAYAPVWRQFDDKSEHGIFYPAPAGGCARGALVNLS
jgi:hypothetical protein